eukprot:m.430993 g.430993  ORF g.430993 m.430993 type:complete len:862 (-) comp17242_c0_seq1:864-3449(-)
MDPSVSIKITRPTEEDRDQIRRFSKRHEEERKRVVIARRSRHAQPHSSGTVVQESTSTPEPQSSRPTDHGLETAVLQSLRASTRIQAAQLQQATVQLQFMEDLRKRQSELGRAVSYSMLQSSGSSCHCHSIEPEKTQKDDRTAFTLSTLESKVDTLHKEIEKLGSTSLRAQAMSTTQSVFDRLTSQPPLDVYLQQTRTRAALHGEPDAENAPTCPTDVSDAAAILERVQQSKKIIDGSLLSTRSRRSPSRRFDLGAVVDAIARRGTTEDAVGQSDLGEREQMRAHVDKMIHLLSQRGKRTNVETVLEEIGLPLPEKGSVSSTGKPFSQQKKKPPISASYSRQRTTKPSPLISAPPHRPRRAVPQATATHRTPRTPRNRRPHPERGPQSYPAHSPGGWGEPQPDDGDKRPPPSREPPTSRPTLVAQPFVKPPAPRPPPTSNQPTVATLLRPRVPPSRPAQALTDANASDLVEEPHQIPPVVLQPEPYDVSSRAPPREVQAQVPAMDSAFQPESAGGVTFEDARADYVSRKLTALLERQVLSSLTEQMMPLVGGAPRPAQPQADPQPDPEPVVDVKEPREAATSPPRRTSMTSGTQTDQSPRRVSHVSVETDKLPKSPQIPTRPRSTSDAGIMAMEQPPVPAPPREVDPIDALRQALLAPDVRDLLRGLARDEERPPDRDRVPPDTHHISVGTPRPGQLSAATSPLPPPQGVSTGTEMLAEADSDPTEDQEGTPTPTPSRPPERAPLDSVEHAAEFPTLVSEEMTASEGEILLSTDGEWHSEPSGGDGVGHDADDWSFAFSTTRRIRRVQPRLDDGALSDGQIDVTAAAHYQRVRCSRAAETDTETESGTETFGDLGVFPTEK